MLLLCLPPRQFFCCWLIRWQMSRWRSFNWWLSRCRCVPVILPLVLATGRLAAGRQAAGCPVANNPASRCPAAGRPAVSAVHATPVRQAGAGRTGSVPSVSSRETPTRGAAAAAGPTLLLHCRRQTSTGPDRQIVNVATPPRIDCCIRRGSAQTRIPFRLYLPSFASLLSSLLPRRYYYSSPSPGDHRSRSGRPGRPQRRVCHRQGRECRRGDGVQTRARRVGNLCARCITTEPSRS